MLNERIEIHDKSRRAAQDKLHELCEGLRAQVAELKSRVNKELEEKSTAEDRRLQALLSGLRTAGDKSDSPKIVQRAKAELLVMQSYDVVENHTRIGNGDGKRFDIKSLYELKTRRKVSFEITKGRKPANLSPHHSQRMETSRFPSRSSTRMRQRF